MTTPQSRLDWLKSDRDRRINDAKDSLGGKCVQCGTEDNLQFDYVDPETKLFNVTRGATCKPQNTFWAEVAKCQLLCKPHHREKSRNDGSALRGENHPTARLRELDVKYVRGLYSLGHPIRAIAREFGVSKGAIQGILDGVNWRHVK